MLKPGTLVAGLIGPLLLAANNFVFAASGVYKEPEQFLTEAFDGRTATPGSLWISGPLREQTTEVLSHAPPSARQRYWRLDERTAWILNEIGKEQPITAGFVVENGRIISAQVLVFRESRGWEIRNHRFTQQFDGAGLLDHTKSNRLDRTIDGISGATLSVRAMNKMARLALLYHAEITAIPSP